MLADQLPAPSSHPEAEAETRLAVDTFDQELEGESTRSYCLAALVLTVGLCVLGVVLYLQYFSGGGVSDSKDDPSEVPQPEPPTQLPPTDAGNVPVIPQEVPTMVDDEWYVQSQQMQTLQKALDTAQLRLTALEHEVKESKQAQRLALQWREKLLTLESEVLKLRHLDAELSALKHKVKNTGNSNPGLDAKLQDVEQRTFERLKRLENDLKKCQESIMIETKTIWALKKEVDGLKSSDAATDFGPRKDIIHIVVDRSGSMSSMGKAPLDGVNEFIEKQREFSKENGNIPCEVSVTTFDNKLETVISDEPIATVRQVTAEEVEPRGMTALVDAIFKAIEDVSARSPDGHPTSKRTIFIITDGEDNQSKRKSDDLHALIKAKRALKNPYLIQFLGTNQDAIKTAAKYGIDKRTSLTYDGRNVKKSIGFAKRQAHSHRRGEEMAQMMFTKEERSKAMAPSA